MHGRTLTKALLVAALVACAPTIDVASATDDPLAESAAVATRLAGDGSGLMRAHALRDQPGRTWSWEACEPNLTACAPFGTGTEVATAGAEPGTLFRATASDGLTAVSPLWHGKLESLAPPAVAGTVTANALVTAQAGTWRGGWEGERDLLQLAACLSPSGTSCTTLTDTQYHSGCGEGAALIDPGFAGRHLRVANTRIDAGTAFLAYALDSPYGGTAWPAGPLTAVAVVGQIAAAPGPPTSACGPPALTRAAISKRGVATVSCGFGCRAVLIGKRGRRQARAIRTIAPAASLAEVPEVTLRLPRRDLSRLGIGRAGFTLRVDGKLLSGRAVRIRGAATGWRADPGSRGRDRARRTHRARQRSR